MNYSKIILCGRRCCGKTTLFWDLQKALNWSTFSMSLYIRDYLHRFNLRNSDQIDAQSGDISREIDERVRLLLTTSDHIVIDARVYGHIDEPLPGTLKVLLTADEAVRVARAAFREGTSSEVQRKRLIRKEDSWIEKMHRMYPFDFFDRRYYDLVVDTTRLTPSQVMDKVFVALN
ncbi:hypothetical protein AUK40_03945 [Candidatus Wirthbacteria bacterium CG2_30_54_11]|uniref:Cytidylate kinase n=1 Tax=Candidatus Wirthbacteria bacterium CG2_30_54_11 TaxID=1817892 RepID=A0A1J5IK96_9BACT|nr:MAG: hypothetical protein AUK40_03945 [Candidatus Wirthbacteria bacterium CG2_30_54_11]